MEPSDHDNSLEDVANRQALVERLQVHVDRLAGLIGPRHLGKPSTMEATIAYIERELPADGESLQHHPYPVGEQETANLIIERPGVKSPEEIIVVGAHYDTLECTPGADDNASAVAVLIEVARMLQGRRFRRTVRFIAFTCEEHPHFASGTMGSDVYARRCRQLGENVIGMLSLEMVGYFRDEPGSQKAPPAVPKIFHRLFPSRGNFLAAVGNPPSWRLCWEFRRGFKQASRFRLFSIVLPEKIRDIRRSDNGPFWDQGYCALMITDTSYLRNPHYHQPTDTPDTLDYDRMAEVAIGVAAAIARLAKSTR
jgi:Zn-dependent M28 family amino/carboxypeptidase